jgi:hypothetical protein
VVHSELVGVLDDHALRFSASAPMPPGTPLLDPRKELHPRQADQRMISATTRRSTIITEPTTSVMAPVIKVTPVSVKRCMRHSQGPKGLILAKVTGKLDIKRASRWHQTPASQIIQNALWIIPLVQTLRILAIAVVLSSVIDLRIFGLAGRARP